MLILAFEKALKHVVCLSIKIYQFAIAPALGPCCRFEPSCSHYALSALETHGLVKGALRAFARILRCHPWTEGGYDPVSPKAVLPKPKTVLPK